MADIIDPQKLFVNYQCAKCRGRSFVTEEVSLRNQTKKNLLRPSNEPYLVVTCGLCGYSEFYSTKVLATQKEEKPAEAKAPIVNESETSG